VNEWFLSPYQDYSDGDNIFGLRNQLLDAKYCVKFREWLKLKEDSLPGVYAVVGCKDKGTFQTWGAMSDLNCKRRRKKKKRR
jgi:hypothetical protein